MTREEAISTLVNATYSDEWQGNEKLTEAQHMAINALEQEPCEDVISRQAAIDAMVKIEQDDIEQYGCAIPEGFDSSPAIEALEGLQPITPQPETGHWIEITQYSDAKHKIECSECGNHIIDRGHANSFNVKNKYKYCPNCGCRMESESESEEWKKNFQMQ